MTLANSDLSPKIYSICMEESASSTFHFYEYKKIDSCVKLNADNKRISFLHVYIQGFAYV